jgi:very-short-patch-repair endonuclease
VKGKRNLERDLLWKMEDAGLPEPAREVRFHPVRRWRFDFAYPDLKLAIEVEGGTYARGRHTRGSGFAKDCRKYNSAALLGWTVLRFPVDHIDDGTAVEMIAEALKGGAA